MGGVYVAAENNGFLLAQFFCKSEEGIVKTHFVVEPLGTLTAIGEVGINEPEVVIFCADEAALLVEFRDAHAINHFQGFSFRIQCDTTVALTYLAGRKEGRISGRGEELLGKLVGIRLGFLETEDVGLNAVQK